MKGASSKRGTGEEIRKNGRHNNVLFFKFIYNLFLFFIFKSIA